MFQIHKSYREMLQVLSLTLLCLAAQPEWKSRNNLLLRRLGY
jgi:hypothetical protein